MQLKNSETKDDKFTLMGVLMAFPVFSKLASCTYDGFQRTGGCYTVGKSKI